jgi:hypothetical protein
MPVSRAVRGIIVGFSLVVLALSSALPVSAEGAASKWRVGYYTPSNPGTLSMSAATQGGGIASFGFTNQPNTALLATTHGSFKGQLLGNLTGRTLTASFEISGATGAFTYFGEGTPDNPCGTPANVRLFFTTDNGGGFAFTHYWWSNPESQVLNNGTFTLTATVEPAEWSDWNGQNGATQAAGFADAASNVTLVGLSFGGGCFFENGVGTTDGSGTFQLDSFTAS